MEERQWAEVELLAPAGDWDCMKAAVANGADAVFFGVEKFNARARGKNFTMDELPEIMSYLHQYGVKGFLTFNILVFEDELTEAKLLVDACIDAGVDAVIVQDLGLVKMIREISPDFPIHGSTQMTITSPEAVEFTKPFHIERVVLGRENNLKQIKQIGDQAKLPMEVFVHGALCVSYSGQCLTSEMWGGRSANRGECAQACRLPYDLMVDGVQKPMGDVAYLLSPKDLAALEIVPELIEAGVRSFKIEGRLKSPEYVANVVSKYRAAIDRHYAAEAEAAAAAAAGSAGGAGAALPAAAGKTGRTAASSAARELQPQAAGPAGPSRAELRELQQSFSRGFTFGFLKGTNNKQLVEGTFPKSRGVYLGRVREIVRDGVVCELEAPLKRGDGIVFDAGDPSKKEEGGRVYDLRVRGQKIDGEASEGERVDIVPGRSDVNLARLHVGDRIWKTNDPHLDKRLRQSFETDKHYRTFPVSIKVSGSEGQTLTTLWTDLRLGTTIQVESELLLESALKRPMDTAFLEEQLGRLGGTLFYLETLISEIAGNVILPMRELNQLRRRAVELLEAERRKPRQYIKNTINVYSDVHNKPVSPAISPTLTVLCRSLEQVEAVIKTNVSFIYADFEFIKQFPAAVEMVRAAGKKIALATPRIHMPGENGFLKNITNLKPDAVLVRNTGALYYYLKRRQEHPAENHPELIGDFSLNVANHKAVELFLESGCNRITPSYDLNIQQMVDMLRRTDASKLEIVIHQHMPMFHTEHCVYCTFLSEGTDFTNCGRPCEEHRVSLQDRIGMSHPVRVDEGCRNTVYNAVEQSGAEYLQNFIELGVPSYRVEFLEESAEKVHEVLDLYSKALAGKVSGQQVWRALKATNQLGVTRGQLVK